PKDSHAGVRRSRPAAQPGRGPEGIPASRAAVVGAITAAPCCCHGLRETIMKEIATLAGGCFWCLEAVYDRMKGVESVESGYIGGKHPNPTYEAVCTGRTGHAEAVRITFDPHVVSYRKLLEDFFAIQY